MVCIRHPAHHPHLLGKSMLQRSWAWQQLQQFGVLSLDAWPPRLAPHWNARSWKPSGTKPVHAAHRPHGPAGRPVRLRHGQSPTPLARQQQQARLLGETLANTIIRRQQLQT
jgi:hypothetical protein